jgi:hypothetical protein
MKTITHEFLVENNLILFETIVGSQAYGTHTPTSDIDKKFVYILPQEYIYGLNYIEQIELNKDYCGWEIKRFLELLSTNNPTVLELLNSPEDCITYKSPLFDLILNQKENFITKLCKNTFGGYARQQIKKAKGLDKKQNWDNNKIVRQDVLDFVYVIEDNKSIAWKVWNTKYDIKLCGLVSIPNARDLYSVYYDENNTLNYSGLVKVGEDNTTISNQLRLSSVPKGETPICNIIYNKDAYSLHCKQYKEYLHWLDTRNETRYVETQSHGQKIDGKNMMHCMRLIRMAKEIGSGLGIIVKRPDAEELLSIRRGELDLDALIELADNEINQMDTIFDNSDLPESVDMNLMNQLLINIRKEFYKN